VPLRDQEVSDTLVSTALRDTWPTTGRAVFLGDWCWASSVLGSQDAPTSLDGVAALSVPYHWEDRSRFAHDADYLDRLVVRVRERLCALLNQRHSTDHSQRFWDIYTGWWALYFTHIYWDRWETVRQATERFPDAQLLRRFPTSATLAPQERGAFFEAFQDDPWNERVSAEIAEDDFGVDVIGFSGIESFSFRPPEVHIGDRATKLSAAGLGRKAFRRVNHLQLLRSQSVALHSDYLPTAGRIQLDLALRQVPQSRALPRFGGPWIEPAARDFDVELGDTAFETSLGRALPKHMPVAYLEGFDAYSRALANHRLPESPRVVATASGHYESDLYSLWVAREVQRGASFKVLQHGGSYGIARINSALSHDKAVADRFLSWGWRETDVTPAPANKLIGIRKTPPSSSGPLVLTLTDLTRYSHWLASQPMPSQHLDVVRFVFRLLSDLNAEILADTVARVLPVRSGWKVRERIQNQFPLIALADDRLGYIETIRNARVVVCTDNSTTLIESLAAGRPTLILWDSTRNELSERGLRSVSKLKEAGVFFDDPATAARHLNSVWNDVSSWWSTPHITRAVGDFLSEFGHVGEHPYRALATAIAAPIPAGEPNRETERQ
jgi:putative transferase (TIGR04331 family)